MGDVVWLREPTERDHDLMRLRVQKEDSREIWFASHTRHGADDPRTRTAWGIFCNASDAYWRATRRL